MAKIEAAYNKTIAKDELDAMKDSMIQFESSFDKFKKLALKCSFTKISFIDNLNNAGHGRLKSGHKRTKGPVSNANNNVFGSNSNDDSSSLFDYKPSYCSGSVGSHGFVQARLPRQAVNQPQE